MSSDKLSEVSITVQKRNGQIVAFNSARIKNAIANAFKEQASLPREADLSAAIQSDVDKVADCIFFVLNERNRNKKFLTVEEIQDEVIRQLYENTYKDVAERYASYRKQHATRRALFELYSTIKRDGRVVSFKPEKISAAIAKAFLAHSAEDLNAILERANKLTDIVISDIRRLWPEGKVIHIEEIQDLVEKALMKEGYLQIAKKYILYREQRAKVRQVEAKKSDTAVDWNLVKNFKIKTATSEEKSRCGGLTI